MRMPQQLFLHSHSQGTLYILRTGVTQKMRFHCNLIFPLFHSLTQILTF